MFLACWSISMTHKWNENPSVSSHVSYTLVSVAATNECVAGWEMKHHSSPFAWETICYSRRTSCFPFEIARPWFVLTVLVQRYNISPVQNVLASFTTSFLSHCFGTVTYSVLAMIAVFIYKQRNRLGEQCFSFANYISNRVNNLTLHPGLHSLTNNAIFTLSLATNYFKTDTLTFRK